MGATNGQGDHGNGYWEARREKESWLRLAYIMLLVRSSKSRVGSRPMPKQIRGGRVSEVAKRATMQVETAVRGSAAQPHCR